MAHDEGDEGTEGRRLPRLLRPLQEFLATEVSGAALVLLGAVIALVWANLAPLGYSSFWSHHLAIGPAAAPILDLSLRDWVNDVAMTLFFFVVGLEIKREVTSGELRDPRSVVLPVVAALGGMLVPAGLYLAINAGGEGVNGWAVPMATDIAFALAVLTIAGRGLPTKLRAFLLTLAIADDIGAILVIALVYSTSFGFGWLAVAVLGVVLMRVLVRLRVSWLAVYVPLAILIWFATYRAGIHPTIAGVILGLATPASMRRPSGEIHPLPRMEHRLHPWSSFLIVPLFALANAGIVLRPAELGAALDSPVFFGVLVGLVVGKILGVGGGVLLGSRLGLGELPGSGLAMVGVAAVAGIGFTVSLFVIGLAFVDPALVSAAKSGVLAASVVAGALGALLLRAASRRTTGET